MHNSQLGPTNDNSLQPLRTGDRARYLVLFSAAVWHFFPPRPTTAAINYSSLRVTAPIALSVLAYLWDTFYTGRWRGEEEETK